MKKILALVSSFVLAIGVNVQAKDLVYHDATQFPLYGTAVKNDSVTDNNVRIVIDIQEMRIHGNSGCNLFNGTLFIDPYKDWGVEFQELVSTRKMCRNIHIETALLVALEETQFCKELENGEIALFDGNGNQIATLKRLNLK